MVRFIIVLLILTRVIGVSASTEISAVFPNTIDDATMEWIEMKNTGCSQVDISGYSISDISTKKYTFPTGTWIDAHTSLRLERNVSKIILNNESETLYLSDPSGNNIDTFSYEKSTKGSVIYDLTLADTPCETTGSGTVGTESPTEVAASSGSTELETSSSTTLSGGSSTGSISSEAEGMSPSSEPLVTPDNTSIGTGVTEESPGKASGTIGVSSGSIILENTIVTTGLIETSSGAISADTSATGIPITLYGEIYTESGQLIAEKMYYSDSDNNGKIDTLEIYYNHSLTGSVGVKNIFLYSRSGGLSTSKIDTASGYIQSGTLSGNILVLTLLEGDIDKRELKVTNGTDSDLRLKSSSDLGFTSLLGQKPEDFLLTKSFDSYKSVFSKGSDAVSYFTPETITHSGAVFPAIIPSIQSPTNATLSGNTFLCDSRNLPCRINFSLEGIFQSGLPEKDYQCHITSNTGVLISCNPNTFYFTESGSIDIWLTHKTLSGSSSSTFSVEFFTSVSSYMSSGQEYTLSKHPPVAVLEYDGKWKTYMEEPEIGHLICYAMTCSINFTAERSYDPDGDEVRFFWMYDYQTSKHTKDPGAHTFSLGSHMMILRVIDVSGQFTEVRYKIDVVGSKGKNDIPLQDPKATIKKEKTVKTKKSKLEGPDSESDTESEEVLVEQEESIKKSKKRSYKSVVFFDAPEVELQNESQEIKLIDGNYYCRTKKKYCSLNFSLDQTIKGYTYEWQFPGMSDQYASKNPRSFRFPIGRSEVLVIAKDSGENERWRKIITVDVQKISAAKKIKKRKSSPSASKPVPLLEGQIETFANKEEAQAMSFPNEFALLFIFSGGVLGSRYVYRKVNK